MQVAAAIVEVTDTLPVGTDGFGTVAQCVVAVMPDMLRAVPSRLS